MKADQADHEVGGAVAGEVAGEEGVATLLEVAQLPGHAAEIGGADESEGIVRDSARIGLDCRQVEAVVLGGAEVEDAVAGRGRVATEIRDGLEGEQVGAARRS